MMTEAQIKAALDGNFYAINFNTGRVIGMSVPVDYVPDHKPQFFDFVPSARPIQAKEEIEDEAPALVDRAPHLHEIFHAVCTTLKVRGIDVKSPRRAVPIVEARQMFYWFARYYTGFSFPAIGMFCGDKDHTTVIHGIKKIDKHYDRYSERLEAIARRLGVALEDRMREAA